MKTITLGRSGLDVSHIAFGTWQLGGVAHLFRREIEDDVRTYTREHNIGVLAYGPLAHGLLTGTLTEDTTFANDDWRGRSALFTGDTYRRNLVAVRALEKFAADRGVIETIMTSASPVAGPSPESV